MTAHAQAAAPFHAQRAAGSATMGPRAHNITVLLFTLIVIMMFTMSSSVLWVFGINHAGITGSAATKIHPATYLAFLTIGFMFLAYRRPGALPIAIITRHPGALTFLIAIMMLAAYIVLDGRKGIASIFDTYLLAVVIPIMAAELDERELARLEKILHVLLAINAALALVEYLIGVRFFPLRFDSQTFEWDTRSNALIGHPLENAQITGIYIMVLLSGGGPNMPKALRPAAVLLQFAALIPFGGRTAISLSVAMTTLWLIPHATQVLRGRRMSLLVYAAIATCLPLLLLALAVMGTMGFFDIMTDRFADDSGSAKTRSEMLELFKYLSPGELLIGANPETIDALRTSMGLEMGIENPVVRLLLYQGIFFTMFLLTGLALFVLEVTRRLRPGYLMPVIFFVIIVNSYESIANKTLSLAQFIVLLIAMYPGPTVRPAPQR